MKLFQNSNGAVWTGWSSGGEVIVCCTLKKQRTNISFRILRVIPYLKETRETRKNTWPKKSITHWLIVGCVFIGVDHSHIAMDEHTWPAFWVMLMRCVPKASQANAPAVTIISAKTPWGIFLIHNHKLPPMWKLEKLANLQTSNTNDQSKTTEFECDFFPSHFRYQLIHGMFDSPPSHLLDLSLPTSLANTSLHLGSSLQIYLHIILKIMNHHSRNLARTLSLQRNCLCLIYILNWYQGHVQDSRTHTSSLQSRCVVKRRGSSM